jgi:hypothetical protein
MTEFIETLFTPLGTTGNTSLSLIYIHYSSPLHALGFSVFTNRILATDLSVSLSLQITHAVFFTRPNSFLANSSVTLDCHLQNSTQFLTIPSNELFFNRTVSTNCSLGTSRYIALGRTPRKTPSSIVSYCFRRVY